MIPTFSGPVLYFGAVLKSYRRQAGLSQRDVAEQMQVTRNTVINWENDKSKPDHALIPQLCSLLKIPLNTLFSMPEEQELTETERRILGDFRRLSPAGQHVASRILHTISQESVLVQETDLKQTYALFFVRPGQVAAGVGDEVPDLPPEYVFLRRSSLSAKADGIVRVRGDSMEPVYHNGDKVFFERVSSAYPGQDVIVDTDDGAVIKRMAKDRTLYSVNPDLPYPSKNDQNTLVIRGRVLGTVSDSDYPTQKEQGILEELYSDELREFRRRDGWEADEP